METGNNAAAIYTSTVEEKTVEQMDQQERQEWASKSQSTCLANAKEDEPIFVLRGHDVSSPKVILHWIAKNFETCPDGKLRDAFECALTMKNYPDRKFAD